MRGLRRRIDRFGLFDNPAVPRSGAISARLAAHGAAARGRLQPSPIGFDCARMGPPPTPGTMEPRWLTSKVAVGAAPATFSSNAEALVARADRDPAMAMPALGEQWAGAGGSRRAIGAYQRRGR